MTFWIMRKFIGGKEPKLTGSRRVTKILGFSMPKLLSGVSRTLFWEFGTAKANGVMKKIVLLKRPLTTLSAFIQRLPHHGLMK